MNYRVNASLGLDVSHMSLLVKFEKKNVAAIDEHVEDFSPFQAHVNGIQVKVVVRANIFVKTTLTFQPCSHVWWI